MGNVWKCWYAHAQMHMIELQKKMNYKKRFLAELKQIGGEKTNPEKCPIGSFPQLGVKIKKSLLVGGFNPFEKY